MLYLLTCFSKNVYIVNWNLGCLYIHDHLSRGVQSSHSVIKVCG